MELVASPSLHERRHIAPCVQFVFAAHRSISATADLMASANCLTPRTKTKAPLERRSEVFPPYLTEGQPTSSINYSFLHHLLLCLSVCLSACLPAWLPVWLAVCLSACLSVCLAGWLAGWLSACLPVWLSTCTSVCQPVCLSVCPSVCLGVCLFSFFLSVFLSSSHRTALHSLFDFMYAVFSCFHTIGCEDCNILRQMNTGSLTCEEIWVRAGRHKKVCTKS